MKIDIVSLRSTALGVSPSCTFRENGVTPKPPSIENRCLAMSKVLLQTKRSFHLEIPRLSPFSAQGWKYGNKKGHEVRGVSIRREIERPNVCRSTFQKRAREISEIFPELFRNGGSGGGCPIMNTFLCAISISTIHHEAYFSRYGTPRRRISYCVEDGDMGKERGSWMINSPINTPKQSIKNFYPRLC